jgi:hypothetical protein
MNSLYEINAQIQQLLDCYQDAIIENEGVIPEELESSLQALEMARDEKIANIGRVYKNSVAEEKMLKDEIANLTKRMKVAKNLGERMKVLLVNVIPEGEKYQDSVSKISWGTTQSIKLNTLPSFLPEDYRVTKVEANKVELTKAIKAGIKIKDVELVSNKYMVIK